jgi:hypothetical protein
VPKPTSKQQVQAKVGVFSTVHIQYSNKLRKEVVFDLASSKPELMQPSVQTISYKAQEMKTLELDVQP